MGVHCALLLQFLADGLRPWGSPGLETARRRGRRGRRRGPHGRQLSAELPDPEPGWHPWGTPVRLTQRSSWGLAEDSGRQKERVVPAPSVTPSVPLRILPGPDQGLFGFKFVSVFFFYRESKAATQLQNSLFPKKVT